MALCLCAVYLLHRRCLNIVYFTLRSKYQTYALRIGSADKLHNPVSFDAAYEAFL